MLPRMCGVLILASLVGLTAVETANAVLIVPPPPITERVAKADCVVAGKIIEVEAKDIAALPSRTASEKAIYRIAVLSVSEGLKGAAEQKAVRVGFLAPADAGGSVVVRPGPRLGVRLKVGQEGLFYLSRHHQEPFFLIPTVFDFIPKQNPNHDDDLALTRFALKHEGKLVKALESKEPQDRLYAAALLLQRYRTGRGGKAKTEPVDAAESKRILAVLAEADWSQHGRISPSGLFSQLGLTAKDGWVPNPLLSAEESHELARAWLRKYADSYRIVRFVAEPAPR